MRITVTDPTCRRESPVKTLYEIARKQLAGWSDADAANALERLLEFDSREEEQQYLQSKRKALRSLGPLTLEIALKEDSSAVARKLVAAVLAGVSVIEGHKKTD